MSDHEFAGSVDYRDVLAKAASYVEQGWCQGRWYAHQVLSFPLPLSVEAIAAGHRPELVCLEGAIRLAAFDLTGDPASLNPHNASTALVAAAEERVAHLVGQPSFLIHAYNDTHGRTADEVAETCRRAAE